VAKREAGTATVFRHQRTLSRCPENGWTSDVSPSRGVSMSPGMTREWSALPSAKWVATVAGASTLELGHKLRFATTDTVIH